MAHNGPPTRPNAPVLDLAREPVMKITMAANPGPAPVDPYVSIINDQNNPLNGLDEGPGINLNQTPLYNLRTPVLDHEAVSKSYLDARAGGTSVGMMVPWLGDVGDVPDGWILCDGKTIGDVGTGADIESNTMEELFELLKVAPTYPNSGTEVWGINTVTLPDMRGRAAVGLDLVGTVNPDTNADEIGRSDNGSHTVSLTLSEMPMHTHTGTANNNGDHTHTGSTGGTGAHSHGTVASSGHVHSGVTNIATSPSNCEGGGGDREWVDHNHSFTTGGPSSTTNITGGNHTHTLTGISTEGDHTHVLTIGSSGSGNPHYNMQPYTVVYWIIRFGATPGSPGFTGVQEMGDLLDVTLSAPAVDDILIYNGLQWVNTPSGGLGGGAGAGISPGTIVPYGGAGAIPPGFLECNGQTELQASYPDLYAVMGTTFNTGGEAGNEFRLPDFRGRVAVGADPGNATLSRSHDIGDYGGEEEHQLTIGELPSHDHPGSAASPDGNHVHGNVPATYNGNQGSGGTNAARDAGGTTSLAGLHSHTVTVSPQGSDQDHETMQPYVGTRWIVAADVSSGGQPINIVPLVGKTFAPVGNAPLIKTDVFNFVAPGSTTDTVDLTAGATVAVPPSATHALIRTNLNVVATAGNIILVQAAKDAIDTKEIKQTRDPSAPEHNDFATWVVEFDGGTFTFEYEIQDVFGSGGAGDNGVLQFYLEGFYIDETANIQNSIGGVPAGTILSWGGNIGTPSGFLDCDGSVVSRATFPELFSTIGTTYNVGGESSLEFRLPNLSGRFVVGDGDSGTTGSTNLNLGDTGGEARHILSVGELATHSHSASGTALLDGAHTHGGVAIAINAADQAGSGMSECQPGATASGGAHTHTLSITVGNQGSSNSHENMPPYLTVKYVIAAVTGAGAQSSGGFYVGDVKPTIRQVSDPGWVIMDDGSIGSAASGATTRANADTEALYTLLWALDPSDTFVPVNGGHGASAAADFAANKWIALPKALGRVLAGADPGNAVLSRPADTGRYTGSENHTLTVGQLPSHTHPIGSHTHPIGGTVPCGTGNAAGPNVGACAGGWSTTANTSGPSSGNTGSQGSDQAHETMQPSLFVNYMIKL